jgi:hypothetical protein
VLKTATSVLMAAAVMFSVCAADNELTDKEKAGGWKLIFNGKDTAGWSNRLSDKLTNWEARDGALTRTAKGTDVVYTAEQFENFELSIDWKTEGNSGVFVRMSDQKDWLNTGMEIQVLPKAGTGPHDAGSLYDLIAPPADAKVNEGGWNNFSIVCNGPNISAKMNGVETFKIDLNDEKWKTAQGKFNKPYATLPRKGFIMLQEHGNNVAYKNIKVKVLDAK